MTIEERAEELTQEMLLIIAEGPGSIVHPGQTLSQGLHRRILATLRAQSEELKTRIEELEKQLTLIGERAVNDWDGEVVGMVDKAVPDGKKYKDWLRRVLVTMPEERDELIKTLKTIRSTALIHQYACWKIVEYDAAVALKKVGEA